MLKIGLDIHGVVDSLPDFFSELTNTLVNAGHEVHILTGRTINEKIYDKIVQYKLSYTHLFSIADYHQKQNTPIHWADDDNPWIDDDIWNKTKADYCKEHKIDLMLDDSVEYARHFETPYALLMSRCLISHKDIYVDKNKEKRDKAFTFIEDGEELTVYSNIKKYLYEIDYGVSGGSVNYIYAKAVNKHDAEQLFKKYSNENILDIKRVNKVKGDRKILERKNK